MLAGLTLKYAPNRIAEQILSGNEPINAELYKHYSGNLRKAVETVYHDSGGDVLKANVSRFAAYKAYHATQIARMERVDKSTGEILNQQKVAQATLKQMQAWQTTEYNTTVKRARVAKQWEQYNEPNRLRLFPNVKWLPSASSNQREEHKPFYNRIWAKNDPFWNSNMPGSLWNCKCSIQETDGNVTENGSVPTVKPARGLEGNPGITGEIFTEKASYFQVENIEQIAYSTARKVALSDAISTLKSKTVEKDTKTGKILIGFNRKGLEHLQYDYFPNKWVRDEYLRKMDIVLQNAEYADEADCLKDNPMVDKFYYYKATLAGKEWFLNVRKLKDGKAYLYSMTEKIKRK